MAITPIELNGLRDRAAWHVEVTEPVIVPLAAGTARAKLEALAQTAATRIRQALRALGLSNPATDNIVVGYADTQNGSYATTLHGRAPNAGSFMIPVVDFVRLQGASQAVRDASAPFIAESDPRISVKLQYVSFPKPGEARDLIPNGRTLGSSVASQGQITLGPKYIPVQRKFSPGGQIIPSQTLILPNIQEFTLTQGQNESIEAMIARIQSFLRVPATLNAEVTATLDRAAAQAEAAAQTAREQAAADAARAAEDAARAEQAAAAAAQAAAAAAEAERLRAIAEAERVAAQAEEARRATLARDNAARQAANAEQQRQAENSAKWRTRGAVAVAILGVLGIGYAATRD